MLSIPFLMYIPRRATYVSRRGMYVSRRATYISRRATYFNKAINKQSIPLSANFQTDFL